MEFDCSQLFILYVDDDVEILENALEYLGRLCRRVLGAHNGLEAFRLYEMHKPDLIISDIKMPKLNGLELAKKIRINDQKTPIIIATAYTDTHFLLDAIELRLIKYLIKPITAEKLQQALLLVYQSLTLQSHNIKKLTQTAFYDTFNKILTRDQEIIKLTKNELLLLDLLVKNSPRTIQYREIETLIWQDEGMSIEALRTLMKSLRKKIDNECVENISGIGYKITLLQSS
jgi:two-component system, OmpR family, response regulator VanR